MAVVAEEGGEALAGEGAAGAGTLGRWGQGPCALSHAKTQPQAGKLSPGPGSCTAVRLKAYRGSCKPPPP
jgi:uncharacterized low-complexity protein